MKAVRGKSIEPSVGENENLERAEGGRRDERGWRTEREREKVSSLSTVVLHCEEQEQGEH